MSWNLAAQTERVLIIRQSKVSECTAARITLLFVLTYNSCTFWAFRRIDIRLLIDININFKFERY